MDLFKVMTIMVRSQGELYTFKGDSSQIFFLLLSEKWSTLKGKNLVPLGERSFLFCADLFQKGLDVQESKQEVIKVVSLAKKINGRRIYQVYPDHLWCFFN